jgi:hypothetical protein
VSGCHHVVELAEVLPTGTEIYQCTICGASPLDGLGQRLWNPRFLAYAASQCRTPEDQLEHDRKAYPGGNMAGFIVWNSQKWREWEAVAGRLRPYTVEDHAAYDAWLSESEPA